MNFCDEVRDIYRTIGQYIRNTPLIDSEHFSRLLGCNLYFKLDNIQHTGSFKVRGALSKTARLSLALRKKGLVAASAGNHGMGVAYAARVFGTHAKIFLPHGTPQLKIDKVKFLGGDIEMSGNSIDDTLATAKQFAQDNDRVFIPTFSSESVIRGQATVAMEILDALPQTDIIICSVGGGGLISGIGAYAKTFKPAIQVYGMETIGTHSMHESLKAGAPYELAKITSIAESIGVRKPTDLTFGYTKKYSDGVFVVPDDQVMKDLLQILQYEKQLVEPASAVSLSGLTSNQIPNFKGKNVVVLLCGANFSIERLKQYL